MTQKTFYKQYLSSRKWKLLRSKARERAGYKCEFCSGPPDHVHHVKYPKRLESDHIDNLVVACERCHSKLHGVREDKTFFGLCMIDTCDGVLQKVDGERCFVAEVHPLFLDDESIREKFKSEDKIDEATFVERFGQAQADWLISSFENGFISLTKKMQEDGFFVLTSPVRSKLVNGWLSGKYTDSCGESIQEHIARVSDYLIEKEPEQAKVPATRGRIGESIYSYLLPPDIFLPFRKAPL